MSVSTINRREGKRTYDYLFFKMQDDAIRITDNNFSASKEMRELRTEYISSMKETILKEVSYIGTHIRKAYSIYPKNSSQLSDRQTEQQKAIGLCYDLLLRYQGAMKELQVPDDKYLIEIENVIHEINSLEKWKERDTTRFIF